jgi:hypothetical protein
MSELSGPQTITDKMAWDTFNSREFFKEAGHSLPGLEIVIDNPDTEGNGEICLRGTSIGIQDGIASWDTSKMKRKPNVQSTTKGSCTQGTLG